MKQHYLRWISLLQGAVTSILHIAFDEQPTHRAFIDVAEQIEYIAKNIRDRAPKES